MPDNIKDRTWQTSVLRGRNRQGYDVSCGCVDLEQIRRYLSRRSHGRFRRNCHTERRFGPPQASLCGSQSTRNRWRRLGTNVVFPPHPMLHVDSSPIVAPSIRVLPQTVRVADRGGRSKQGQHSGTCRLTALDSEFHSGQREVLRVARRDARLDCQALIVLVLSSHDTTVRVIAETTVSADDTTACTTTRCATYT